jgi:hypothetical protein
VPGTARTVREAEVRPRSTVDWRVVKRIALAGATLLVAAVAGCGKSSPALYTRDATSACLKKAGVRIGSVSATNDFVANSATGGAFVAKLADNSVTVSFGLTQEDATNIAQAYDRFHAQNVGLSDVLRTQENAVMLWHAHPSDADLATVTGCLKS